MVQRFELELYHCNGGDMAPDEDGAYVAYEDYAALEEAYAQLREQYDLEVNPERK